MEGPPGPGLALIQHHQTEEGAVRGHLATLQPVSPLPVPTKLLAVGLSGASYPLARRLAERDTSTRPGHAPTQPLPTMADHAMGQQDRQLPVSWLVVLGP